MLFNSSTNWLLSNNPPQTGGLHESFGDLTAIFLALSQLDGAASPFDALSEREFEVFVRLARGRSVNDIASQLSLSPSTVGTHLYNIKQKLGAGNQAELTLLALRWGVIDA